MVIRAFTIAAVVVFAGFPAVIDARTPPRQADPAYLATIVDDDPFPLPRGLAPWERRVVPDFARLGTLPPAGEVRAQAEYEPMRGIFIRWGQYNSLHTAMAVPLTTASPPATVWVVVSGLSQENSARTVLQNGGADLDHVEFLHANTDSVWMRDYGPRFIDNDGALAISDHQYNRPRPNDDVFPSFVASDWSMPLFDLGLVHGGGNFHLFGNRDAFMTRLIVNENPGVPEAEIIDRYEAHQGVNLTLTNPFPQSYDSTQHIDMWMLPLGPMKVLIGEYQANQGGGIPRQVTEATAAAMAARGFKVQRTPGWNSGGAHYTYTNSVIVNSTVLVCQFNGYPTQNAQAVSAYQAALPTHDIVPVDCSDIIGLSGAIHCIVMHVPEVVLFRDTFDEG
jgi:agmatine deiminase